MPLERFFIFPNVISIHSFNNYLWSVHWDFVVQVYKLLDHDNDNTIHWNFVERGMHLAAYIRNYGSIWNIYKLRHAPLHVNYMCSQYNCHIILWMQCQVGSNNYGFMNHFPNPNGLNVLAIKLGLWTIILWKPWWWMQRPIICPYYHSLSPSTCWRRNGSHDDERNV